MIYPDLEFTLSLLVKGDRTQEASNMLRDVAHPLELSLIHRIQIENGLLRALHATSSAPAKLARDGLLLWREYLLEEVFSIQTFDLDAAFAQACAWNSSYHSKPPKWSLLVHPALAASAGSVFMSFNPLLRKCASQAGLKLLPEKL